MSNNAHVCKWTSDDQQTSIVVGLGPSAEAAMDAAVVSINRGDFEIDGGYLVVSEIAGGGIR